MKQLLLFITTVLVTGFSFAQNREIDITNTRDGESVEYCVTHKKMKEMLKNPAFLKIHAANQAMLEEREEELKNSKQSGTVYTIPVVFHVLHNDGVENISRDQILDALSILTRDFRMQNADTSNVVAAFQGMPSDSEIEFALATKAPNGACFGGITRTKNALTNDGSNGWGQVSAIKNGNDIYNGEWAGDKYLNIFVVNDAGGAAGYTFNPSWSGMDNGIWILHDYVGSIGTGSTGRSRALTHEVGHWLNLSHTWGPNNNPGNLSSCSDDDGVTDTPNTIGVTSCNLNENTCGPLANVENYMDYSYCSKMFTQGQVNRMRAALTSSVANRKNLWTTANLAATGAAGAAACKAVFETARTTICAGETIDFTDQSYNNITTWNWTFNGGSASSTTVPNPSVTYSTPGTYSVSLQAGDGANTVSATKSNYITVLPAPGAAMPIYEGFEEVSSIPNNTWLVENPGGQAWSVSSLAASTGSKSIRLYNYANTAGDEDEFISKTYDLSNMNNITVSFKYAFAKKSDANTDKLQFSVSTDCGDNWMPRKVLQSSQIATAPNTSSNFIPTADQWTEVIVTNINVSSFMVDNFRFKFHFIAGGGNNVYIDDINIWGVDNQGNGVGTPNMTGIKEVFGEDLVSLYPNPASSFATLSINLAKDYEEVSISVVDMLGKQVKQVYNGTVNAGEQRFNIATSDLSKGVYHVIINGDGKQMVNKLIVE